MCAFFYPFISWFINNRIIVWIPRVFRYMCAFKSYNTKWKLFKRDFAGELLDAFPSLDLVDYGFVYHRDPNFPQDDMNWFLLEKK